MRDSGPLSSASGVLPSDLPPPSSAPPTPPPKPATNEEIIASDKPKAYSKPAKK